MASVNSRLWQERVNLRTILAAFFVSCLGIVLLYISSRKDWWGEHEAWDIVVRETGALLFVTVAVAVLWELVGKRAFLDEVLEKAKISKELSFAGIVKITDTFHDKDISWDAYFQKVNKLDIFFAYGRTWRNAHNQELKKLSLKNGARIRVILPDPEDSLTMQELARRFRYTPEHMIELINEAIKDFGQLCEESKNEKGASIDVWLLPASPHVSLYRFDETAILALYPQREDRVPVPTFICESGGTLYDYLQKEFYGMLSEKNQVRAKLVATTSAQHQ